MSFPTHFLSPSTFFRCEAINKANEANPAVTQMSYRVFFPPKSLRIVVDRADKEIGYDRTIDFESSASNTRNREDLRIVVEGELVRIRCQAGNTICRHPQEFSALFCNNTNMGDPLLQNRYFFPWPLVAENFYARAPYTIFQNIQTILDLFILKIGDIFE